MSNRLFFLLLVNCAAVLWGVAGCAAETVQVQGELKKWHTVTLRCTGPETSEDAAVNPFTDYRLDVTFRNGERVYVVPGYYAADGDAANSSATSGNVWLVHFIPTAEGEWRYRVAFRTGAQVAVSDDPQAGKSAGYCDAATGSFNVGATDKTGRDLRGKGLLEYVNQHHLRFAETGEYFLKGGADAPENFLAYADFDGDFKTDGEKDELIKTWEPHIRDWQPGDPTWQDGKGKGMIGALNYLASKGMNAFSFLTMNIQGDDRNVFPYTTSSERSRMDCSRLAQWEIVFTHADQLGLHLHFKTQETENDHLLDGGELGPQRTLYYRELIARFSHHLALNWNLGEENMNSAAQRKAFAAYFATHDPYHHPIVLHTFPKRQEEIYRPLLGDASQLTGVSLQCDPADIHGETLKWVKASTDAGKPWVVANDEQGSADTGVKPDADDPGHDSIRAQVLWGNLLAGGGGVEYYFGYKFAHSDLNCQDFRTRDGMWEQTRYALEFFTQHKLPFWAMTPDDAKSSATVDYCLYQAGQTYIIYLKTGGSTTLDLTDQQGDFGVQWFNPRSGGELQTGTVATVSGGDWRSLGDPPTDPKKDWIILVQKQ